METTTESQEDIQLETLAPDVFIPPSITRRNLLNGDSYTHFSEIPSGIAVNGDEECVLGVDEAGRGPVLGAQFSHATNRVNAYYYFFTSLGPMVYALLYLPMSLHHSLLAEEHHFDDSKVLTPMVRSRLMEALCTPGSDLHGSCGWATRVMSARDISAAMLHSSSNYNLNAQAMDATIDLIREVFDRGVNVKEVYIDTIGSPITYQKKLERIFPTTKITVAKKADSLYPCVSAASVCAKVTRDAALEVCYESYHEDVPEIKGTSGIANPNWGSGYPSDARCTSWLKRNMDPVFGWGSECRFSWGTAKDLIESKGARVRVDWPEVNDEDTMKMTDFFAAGEQDDEKGELANWFGARVGEKVF